MHLSSETALDLIEGRLESAKCTFWERHLLACKPCEQEFEAWGTMQNLLKRSHLQSAPDDDLANVIGFFRVRPGRPDTLSRRVKAAIVFNSRAEAVAAGARGAVKEARQMVLRAEEFDIHVRISDDADHKHLIGQLLPRGGGGFVRNARLHLLCNGERIETTCVDELGEFHFKDIPSGLLSLQIDLPNLTVIGALNIPVTS